MCIKSEIGKKSSGFEQGIVAELIYQTSDISQQAKWPLRILAVVCALGSALVWELKYDWPWYLNNKSLDSLGSFLRFTAILSVILKAGIFISFTVAAISLAFFIFSFFKTNTSKVMSEAIEVLLSNSFFFGISLVFILSTVLNIRQATSHIILVTNQKIECSAKLEKLGKILMFYAKQNHYHYPPPDKWCDVLLKNTKVTETDFLCPGATEINGHYAINPNAEPISRYDDFDSFLDSLGINKNELWPHIDTEESKRRYESLLNYYFTHSTARKKGELSNIVLLFETDGPRNQFGELELLTAEHHNKDGANILFNDGRVKFIAKDQFAKLKWKVEEDKSDRKGFYK